MPDLEFESEALKVNLERTRVFEIRLSEDHQWFLEITRDSYGLNKRVEGMLRELYHPYSNAAEVARQLREIALQDRWFYQTHPESGHILEILVATFEQFLERSMDPHIAERTIRTIVELADHLLHPDVQTGAMPVIHRILSILETVLPTFPQVNIRASSFLKNLGSDLAGHPEFSSRMTSILKSTLQENIRFWLNTSDIESWFQGRRDFLDADYPELIRSASRDYLESERKKIDAGETWNELVKCIDFKTISGKYRDLISDVASPMDRSYFILYLLHLPGMDHLKEPLLWDLNRTLQSIRKDFSGENLTIFLERLFSLFGELKSSHMSMVLDCVETLGREICVGGNSLLTQHFIDLVIRLGFVLPGLSGVDANWQIKVDPNHIKNVRVWLHLVECNPPGCIKLLSALIVNLKIEGIFIADTDLFQRDITQLLNSNISPCYKLVKQLTRQFPVYYSEIGAEGELREITTAMDELTHRQDRLIHFLRKQIHTESNNTHIELTRKVIQYWFDGCLEPLEPDLPDEIKSAVTDSGEWFEPVHEAVKALCAILKMQPKEIVDIDLETLQKAIEGLPENIAPGAERIYFLARLQGVLKQKYTLDATAVIPQMSRMANFTGQTVAQFEKLLAADDPESLIEFIFRIMRELREVILNPEPSAGREDIYHKRHIAAGIPSMYGRYREPKFEALGLTFRLEQMVDKYLHRWIAGTNLRCITARTLRRIVRVLEIFRDGLELDGVSSEGFSSNLNMLKFSLTTASFSMDQILNLFQFMSKNIKEIIQEYFLGYHDTTLKTIVTQQAKRQQSGPVSTEDILKIVHKKSETFYRDIITQAFLIQQLDNFISDITNTLKGMLEQLTPETIRSVMSYDPDLISSPIHQPTVELDNQVFLGAKGYFLKKLHSYHFPIPPGFILTTEVFRRRNVFSRYPEMFREIFQHIEYRVRELETLSGKGFGDPRNPLLLSVRSGGAISLPGAMNTFLNVGMNDAIAENLSRQPNYGWTSWDCYRRFLQSWGMAYGISRDKFDETIIRYKREYDVAEKIQFTQRQMRTIAYAYKDVLMEHGVKFEDDLIRQLIQAIFAVLDSWFTERARIYRKQLQIAEEWGTAVIVQQMVLGNINYDSGTGVVFTKDPFESKPGLSLFGDFTMCSQGEDVVAGLVHTLPVSEAQRQRVAQDLEISLEKDFPEIFRALLNHSAELIHERGYGHQEIEFTFETKHEQDFYILQTRDQITQKEDKIPIFDVMDRSIGLVGSGIGVGGGAMTGIVAFDQDDLTCFEKIQPRVNRILIRPDTVPDDIGMIFNCEGLLTARGGATSHAAVTAVRLGKTCVVNCRVLKVNEEQKKCSIKGVEFQSGDRISIDGRLGNIYRGHLPIIYAPMELP
ncbi:pyruvate phosphate dikinase [bacterium]|nr:pyruvate phosphate dikinase [candidate division CSSED10-310 bacterium]